MISQLFVILIAHFHLMPILAQEERNYVLERHGNDIMWCVTSKEELTKCQDLSNAVDEAQKLSEVTFGSYYRKILCKHYTSKDECMKLIDEGLRCVQTLSNWLHNFKMSFLIDCSNAHT